MIPYIGQIVLYRGAEGDKLLGNLASPAVVTTVWSATCLNIELLAGPGKGIAFQSLPSKDQGHGYWTLTDMDAALSKVTDKAMEEARNYAQGDDPEGIDAPWRSQDDSGDPASGE